MSTKPVGRMRTFFREVRIEMKKVTWPPRKELIKSTGVVIVAVVVAAVFIGAVRPALDTTSSISRGWVADR